VSFDIFGTRDGRRKQARGWTAVETFLYCESILDFVETHVCSLVYKFAFFTACVSHLHFALCHADMAISVRACLDLLSGSNSCRSGTSAARRLR
jgi:hypothetical protein